MTLLAKNTPSGDTSTFVMLANVTRSANTDADGLAGKTREEVMQLFTFSMPDKGVWKDGELPMWGVSDPVRVDHSAGAVPKLGTVYLVRAVARVDVGLNLSYMSEGASTFDEKAGGIEGITLTKVFFIIPIRRDGSLRSRTGFTGMRPIERRNSLLFLIRLRL